MSNRFENRTSRIVCSLLGMSLLFSACCINRSVFAAAAIVNDNSADVSTYTLPTGTNLLTGATASPAAANTHEGSSASWATLADGLLSTNGDKTASVTPNNGDSVTFTLDTSVNTFGYNLTSFDFYSAWPDSGREDMDFIISYSTVANPTTFIFYTTVANHSGNNAVHTRITDTTATKPLNVKAIQFSFANQENGYVGLREFVVLGTAATSTAPSPGAGVLSMNFESNNSGGGTPPGQNFSTPLASTDVAGLVPVANWNNSPAANSNNNGTLALNFSTGGITGLTTTASSGASVTWASGNTWADGNDNSPNEKLFHGYLDDNHNKAIITGIPFAGYDVFFYHHGDNGTIRNGNYFAVTGNDPGEPAFGAAGSKFGFNTFVYTPTLGDGAGGYGNVIFLGHFNSSAVSIYSNNNNDRGTQRAPFNGFQIVESLPTLISVSPSGGPVTGGTNVIISGTDLASGLTASAFTFGGTAATAVVADNSPNSYTVTVPAHAVGAVNVVYTDSRHTNTLTNGFTYSNTPPPAIFSVATSPVTTPASGSNAGGTTITITGGNFRGPMTVRFGGQNGMTAVNVTGLTPTNSSTLTLTTPAAAPAGSNGFTTITVIDTDTGGSGSLASAFKYTSAAPAVTSISPSSGAYNATTNVTINGTGFATNFATGGGIITVGGQNVTNIAFVSANQLTATVQPMTTGMVGFVQDTLVTNPDGGASTANANDQFTYTGGRVPENDTGVQNKIFYRYFHDPAIGATLPTNNGTPIVPLAYSPAIAVNKTGFATIMEFNGNPYLPDGVAQYNGDATWQNDNYSVEYRGFLNVPTDGVWTLYTASDDGSFFMIGDQTANTLVVSNNFPQGTTERSGTIALKAGFHRFIVQYSEGGGGNELRVRWSGPSTPKETLPQGSADGTARGFYTESTPVLSTANPSPNAAMPQAGGQTITVTGTGFGSYVTGLVIKDSTNATIGTFNNPSPAPTFTVVGGSTVVPSTMINGFNSPSTINGGPASVTVTTLFGQTASLVGGLPNGLTYLGNPVTLVDTTPPTPTGISPASGPSSGNLPANVVTLTATAANFTPTGVFVKVDSAYNGYGTISSAGTTVTGVGTQFTAQLQAGDSITASGQTQIVTSINSNTVLTMTGAFSPVLATGTNYTILKAAITIDASHVSFIPPPHVAGKASLSIINGDGQSSTNTLTNEYTYLAPTVTSITTTTPSAGTDPNIGGTNKGYTYGGNTVTIVGTNFGPTTIVSIGGNPATNVTINSNTVLTCVVPANTSAQTPFNVNVVVSDNQSTPSIGTLTNGYQYIAVPATLANASGKVPGLAVKFYANGNSTIPSGAVSGSVPPAGTATFEGLTPFFGKLVTTNVAAGPNSSASPGTILSLVPSGALNFYSKISGYLQITTPGTYTIFLSSDDASLFYLNDTVLNNTLIVNNNIGPQGVTKLSGTIALGAGLHPFTILYGQGTGGYGLSISYSGPDTSNTEAIISDNKLWSDVTPSVTSVSPVTGSTLGGTTVTITGTGFVGGAQVSFGTLAGGAALATNVIFVNSTTLICNAPAGANGAANVVVVNPIGTSDTLVSGYLYDNTLKRDPEYATPAAAKAVQGVLARYYKNLAGNGGALPTFAGNVPFRVAPEQAVQGTIGEIVPDSGVNGTVNYPQDQQATISFQFNGYLNVPYDGTWTFYTSSDDGSNLYIGNTLVVNNNFSQGITTRSGTIALKAGLHFFTLQYCNGGGGYGCYFSWGSNDTPTNGATQIPTSATNPPAVANRIPSAAVFYVPPTFIGGAASNNWSSVTNWSTDSGLGAFAPNQTDNADTGNVSTVFRFKGNGATPYTANNDSVNNTPFYILELNSNVNGNVISGNTFKSLGTSAVVKYDGTVLATNGLTKPAIIKTGSGTTTISAPIFNRDSLILSGNGTGFANLNGALTNYANGTDIKSIYKVGTSTFAISGDASTYIGDGTTNMNGFVEVDGGTLAINGNFGTASGSNYPNANVGANGTAGVLRGTGNFNGLLKVGAMGTVFPGDVTAINANSPLDLSNSLTNGPKGQLQAAKADFSAGGKLTVRVFSTAANNLVSDSFKVAAGQLNLNNATLELHIQTPSGLTYTNQDTLIADASDGFNALNTSYFTNVTNTTSPATSNVTVLYVDPTFTPGSSTGIVSTQTVGSAPTPNGGFDRIFVRLSGRVTPVTVDSFTAKGEGAGVLLAWNCVSEFLNTGFNVYRRSADGWAWNKVNASLIPGRVTSADQKLYQLYDWATPGEYQYKLESISINNVAEAYKTFAGPITVDPNMATADALDAGGISAVDMVSDLAANASRTTELSALFATASKNTSAVNGTQLLPAVVKMIDLSDGQTSANVAESDATNSNAVSSSPRSVLVAARWFTSGSVIGSSTFVAAKVRYTRPGVMMIPAAALPAGINPGHLAVQREGRTIPVLAQTAAGLLVYGQGYEDDYTNVDALFLRSTAAATVAGHVTHAQGLFTSSQTANGSTPASVTASYHDTYYDYNNAFRPYTFAPWFSSKYLTADGTSGTTQSFTITTPFASSGPATLTVNAWSLTSAGTSAQDHVLRVVINGAAAGQAVWNGGNKMVQLTFQIPPSALMAGDNAIDLVTPPIEGVGSQIAFLHSLTCDYARTLDGSQPVTLTNSSSSSQLYELSNMPSADTWVVDARFPDRAGLVPYESADQGNGTFKIRFVGGAGGTGQFLVVPAGMENAPNSVIRRQVKPVKLTASYLAVGPNAFNSSIQPLLAQRAKEGLRGSFVDQEQLFDNYNSGRYGPVGIQSAVRALHPQYLLLVGRSMVDYKNYSGLNIEPLCPSFLVSTSFWAQTTSDSAFGDLGRGYPEVRVGRIPANDTGEATVAVKNILAHPGMAVSGWRGQMVADESDPAVGDFAAEGDGIIAANPSISWDRNYYGVTYSAPADTTEAMRKAACGDADFIVYTGHGNAIRLGGGSVLLDTTSVQTWTGNGVMIAATCTFNWTAKAARDYRSIPIQALVQPQGGLSASISTTTYMNSAPGVEFAKQLIKQCQTSGSQVRWGDVLLRSQQWAYAQRGSQSDGGWYLDLSRTECLLGDPAMPVYGKGAVINQVPATNTGSKAGTF